MTKSLNSFLSKLKAPHSSFGIKGLDLNTCKAYEYEKYDCEIALLHQCRFDSIAFNQELEATFKKIFLKEHLELHHPIHNHIKTRAVLAVDNTLASNGGKYNKFVFFVDESNQYPWILINENEFAQIIITQEGLFLCKALFKCQDFAKWTLWLCLTELPKIARNLNAKDISFCDKRFAISLDKSRPFHYFSDDLHWFYRLDLQDCKVLKTPIFFVGDKVKNIIEDKERLGIFPALYIQNRSLDYLSDEISNLIANKELLIEGGGGRRYV